MSGSRTFHFKLVLLGDSAVGKSCLVVRFVRDEFFEFQEPTIGGKRLSSMKTGILSINGILYALYNTFLASGPSFPGNNVETNLKFPPTHSLILSSGSVAAFLTQTVVVPEKEVTVKYEIWVRWLFVVLI